MRVTFFLLFVSSFANAFDAQLGAWLPVASTHAIRDILPIKIKIANLDWVVWRDNNDEWGVQRDACAHRFAPLSQGRISSTGCLECPYHGWEFDTTGSCVKIPQAYNHTRVRSHQTSLKTLPTHLTNDLLWAFFPSSLVGEKFPQSRLPEDSYPVLKDTKVLEYFTRELPYSWDFLVEKIMDPSHIPFAHHSLQGRRDDAVPIEMKVLVHNHTLCEVGFKDRVANKNCEGVVSIQRPAYYHFRTKSPDGIFRPVLNIFIAPVAHGRCRVHFAPPFAKKIPRWLVHAASNRFLNTDVWLHEAEIHSRGTNETYTSPTSSDVGPDAFRKWWRRVGLSEAPLHTFGPAPIEDLRPLSRSEQIDPFVHHSASMKGVSS